MRIGLTGGAASTDKTFKDVLSGFFGGEEQFLAIIIDTLGGNDNVTVHETVQRTVWIDAGAGDDVVRIEPQFAILPDRTDPFLDRNDRSDTPARNRLVFATAADVSGSR